MAEISLRCHSSGGAWSRWTDCDLRSQEGVRAATLSADCSGSGILSTCDTMALLAERIPYTVGDATGPKR